MFNPPAPSPGRHARVAPHPPRSFVGAAAVALALGTAFALWLLPGNPDRSSVAAPVRVAGRTTPGPHPAAMPPPARPRPAGLVGFVDSDLAPRVDLATQAQRAGTRWFTIGYVTAGRDGCTPKWGGRLDPGLNPVANTVGKLRAAGGDVGIAFGGPRARELATTCSDVPRLAAAYRRMIGAFDARLVEFEILDSDNAAAGERRARALILLQREAAAAGRELKVSYTVPATLSGLSYRDLIMLRQARQLGVDIATINLLVKPSPNRPATGSMISSVNASARELAAALGVDVTRLWTRIGIAPLAPTTANLSPADARQLLDFMSERDLAWLSLRGMELAPVFTAAVARTAPLARR